MWKFWLIDFFIKEYNWNQAAAILSSDGRRRTLTHEAYYGISRADNLADSHKENY